MFELWRNILSIEHWVSSLKRFLQILQNLQFNCKFPTVITKILIVYTSLYIWVIWLGLLDLSYYVYCSTK